MTGQDGGRAEWPLPLLLAVLAAAPLMFAPQLLNDGDSFWHLATGDWMLTHGAVVQADPFSHTVPGRSWTAHEWLAEILLALAHRGAGWPGVMAMTALAVGALVFVVSDYLRRWQAPAATLLLVLLMAACLPPSLLARPHVLAWPVMALWVVGLLRAGERGGTPSWMLLPVMTLWANLHGSFVLGLALTSVLGLEAVLARAGDRRAKAMRWTAFAAAAVLAACVTPHGPHGLVFPFQLMGMQTTPWIAEWRPADFSSLGGFEIALLAAIFAVASRGLKLPLLRLLLVLGLLHMALQHARHQPVAGILTVLLAARPFGSAQPPWRGAFWAGGLLGAALAAAIVLRLAMPAPVADGPSTPVTALAHLPPELRRQPVFNEYGVGGYLIAQGVRPFIDGRADMYGDAFIIAYDRATNDPARLKAALDGYGVRWTLLQPASPAVRSLDRDPAWTRLWSDPYAVVHVRAR